MTSTPNSEAALLATLESMAVGDSSFDLLSSKTTADCTAAIDRNRAAISAVAALIAECAQCKADYQEASKAATMYAAERDEAHRRIDQLDQLCDAAPINAIIARNAELEADAARWREVSDKAWFIDAAAYVYGLRTGTFEPTPDEVITAIDAAISQHERP